MSEPRRAPEPAPRRSAVRRDLLVIAAASVVAVWLGVSFDLFRHLHRELDAAPGIYADAVVGAIVILVIAAGSFAFIRNRAARTEEALRTAVNDGNDDPYQLQQVIRRTTGRCVNQTHRRRPMIIPVVVEA